jgi:Domain of unknown function (DUF6285)
VTQDRPDAPELLDAVAEFLFADVREWAPPEKRFVALVAANVCAVVARELRAGEDPSRADVALFNEMLGAEPGEPLDADVEREARDAAKELARRIREGDFDAEMEETAARLREHVRRKLKIARPGYSGAGPDS